MKIQNDKALDIALDGIPVYDVNVLIPEIEDEYQCDAYEAADFIAHSTVGVPGAPIIMQLLEDE